MRTQTVYVKPNDATAVLLVGRAFPGARVSKVAINVHDAGGMALTSYWSGGTRDYHAVVRLADMQVWQVPENGSGYSAVDRAFGPAGMPLELPAPGFAVVTFTDGCYKAVSCHIHRDNAAKLIAAPVEVTWAEKVVLVATRALKSSHCGVKDYRFQEARRDTGITRAEWDAAVSVCKSRGFLNAAGAISIDGRNVAGHADLYRMKRVADDTKLGADRLVGETEARTEV